MKNIKSGYVYVISNPAWHNDAGYPVIKIGRTYRAPHHRVRELSQGCLSSCVLEHSVYVPDAAQVEQILHMRYQIVRVRGEFYSASVADVVAVLELFQQTPVIPQAAVAQPRRRIKTSRHPGVDFHKASGKYRARISINGEQHYVGYFDTEDQAFVAREHYRQNPLLKNTSAQAS